jgi:hypothetical protein
VKYKGLVGFEVLMAVSMKMVVFWVVAPCSLVEVYQHFRGQPSSYKGLMTNNNKIKQIPITTGELEACRNYLRNIWMTIFFTYYVKELQKATMWETANILR